MKLKYLSTGSDSESVFSMIEPFELPPPALTPEFENSENFLSTNSSSDIPSIYSEEISESFMSSSGKKNSRNLNLYQYLDPEISESNSWGNSGNTQSENNHEISSQEENYSFKLPPASLFISNDEILRPSLFRKGSSWDTKKTEGNMMIQCDDELMISPNGLQEEKGDSFRDSQKREKKIHPESILNFLKKNCPIGQAKLLSDYDTAYEVWNVAVSCADF